MDSKVLLKEIKKYIINFLKIVVLILLGGLLIIFILIPVTTRYSMKTYSPDGNYYAQVSETNGGATTSFNTGIRISRNIFLSNFGIVSVKAGYMKSVFAFNGSLDNLSADWIDTHTLRITCEDFDKIYAIENSWNDIKIVYDESCDQKKD